MVWSDLTGAGVVLLYRIKFDDEAENKYSPSHSLVSVLRLDH